MSKTTVWTKQHKNILDILNREGRYIVKREYIVEKMQDISKFYLDVYDWYANAASVFVPKPPDVRYPIWVSLAPESVIALDDGTVLLELELDESQVIEVDYDKWGYIVNYRYIPTGPEDALEHKKMLEKYGVDDAQAYMSNFYPIIKKQIIKSWDRLFDKSNAKPSDVKMGTIWEVKKEWIKSIQ